MLILEDKSKLNSEISRSRVGFTEQYVLISFANVKIPHMVLMYMGLDPVFGCPEESVTTDVRTERDCTGRADINRIFHLLRTNRFRCWLTKASIASGSISTKLVMS